MSLLVKHEFKTQPPAGKIVLTALLDVKSLVFVVFCRSADSDIKILYLYS